MSSLMSYLPHHLYLRGNIINRMASHYPLLSYCPSSSEVPILDCYTMKNINDLTKDLSLVTFGKLTMLGGIRDTNNVSYIWSLPLSDIHVPWNVLLNFHTVTVMPLESVTLNHSLYFHNGEYRCSYISHLGGSPVTYHIDPRIILAMSQRGLTHRLGSSMRSTITTTQRLHSEIEYYLDRSYCDTVEDIYRILINLGLNTEDNEIPDLSGSIKEGLPSSTMPVLYCDDGNWNNIAEHLTSQLDSDITVKVRMDNNKCYLRITIAGMGRHEWKSTKSTDVNDSRTMGNVVMTYLPLEEYVDQYLDIELRINS